YLSDLLISRFSQRRNAVARTRVSSPILVTRLPAEITKLSRATSWLRKFLVIHTIAPTAAAGVKTKLKYRYHNIRRFLGVVSFSSSEQILLLQSLLNYPHLSTIAAAATSISCNTPLTFVVPPVRRWIRHC